MVHARSGDDASAAKHDERRRRIADVVVRVIAENGLEAATVRRIAAEVGFSTTVVTYYFADKNELLLSAYRTLGEFAHDRFEETVARAPDDLVGYLMSMSATDATKMAFWRTFVAIWDKSLRDPVFAAELNRWIEDGLRRIEIFLRVLKPDCADASRAARRLLGLVQGISTQILFDPQSWSAEAVRSAFQTEIDLLLSR